MAAVPPPLTDIDSGPELFEQGSSSPQAAAVHHSPQGTGCANLDPSAFPRPFASSPGPGRTAFEQFAGTLPVRAAEGGASARLTHAVLRAVDPDGVKARFGSLDSAPAVPPAPAAEGPADAALAVAEGAARRAAELLKLEARVADLESVVGVATLPMQRHDRAAAQSLTRSVGKAEQTLAELVQPGGGVDERAAEGVSRSLSGVEKAAERVMGLRPEFTEATRSSEHTKVAALYQLFCGFDTSSAQLADVLCRLQYLRQLSRDAGMCQQIVAESWDAAGLDARDKRIAAAEGELAELAGRLPGQAAASRDRLVDLAARMRELHQRVEGASRASAAAGGTEAESGEQGVVQAPFIPFRRVRPSPASPTKR
eukprot:TRINITY_DN26553_c0_g1_i1.p1 TRINITY_DN26553_c0_g1~~TRINITY_DN26553_c0_g1_i1.p1  ORF type:complete len:398 (+),score=104.95 TRINITY_DN26553_c0_g1_i1:89-1195(+)